jgi:predicted secreted Zn-dependent protease
MKKKQALSSLHKENLDKIESFFFSENEKRAQKRIQGFIDNFERFSSEAKYSKKQIYDFAKEELENHQELLSKNGLIIEDQAKEQIEAIITNRLAPSYLNIDLQTHEIKELFYDGFQWDSTEVSLELMTHHTIKGIIDYTNGLLVTNNKKSKDLIEFIDKDMKTCFTEHKEAFIDYCKSEAADGGVKLATILTALRELKILKGSRIIVTHLTETLSIEFEKEVIADTLGKYFPDKNIDTNDVKYVKKELKHIFKI